MEIELTDANTPESAIRVRASFDEIRTIVERIRAAIRRAPTEWLLLDTPSDSNLSHEVVLRCQVVTTLPRGGVLRRLRSAMLGRSITPGIRRVPGGPVGTYHWHDSLEAWVEHAEKIEVLLTQDSNGKFCELNASPTDDVTVVIRRADLL